MKNYREVAKKFKMHFKTNKRPNINLIRTTYQSWKNTGVLAGMSSKDLFDL